MYDATKRFLVVNDPGHAWIKVEQSDLDAVGMSKSDFSNYSYADPESPGTYYLEEDCDLSLFFRAYERKFGKKPECEEIHSEEYGDRIRAMPRINA